MGKLRTVREIWQLIVRKRLWLLLPIIILLLLFGIFLVVTETSALAPILYTIF